MSNDRKETNPSVFHDHLDVCRQCREQPFNLCDIGSNALLKAVGRENDPQHTRPPDPDTTMSELTLEALLVDPTLFATVVGLPMAVSAPHGPSLSLDRLASWHGTSMKTNFTYRLFLDALRHDKSSAVCLNFIDDMAELDSERMSELFKHNFEPTLTTKGIDVCLPPKLPPKEKAWVAMNEQHARRSQRLGSKRKKR